LIRVFHETGDAVEETASAAAVEDAVVEAEGEFGDGVGLEGTGGFVPDGLFGACAEAEDEVLFREGDGGGPEDAEGAVVSDGGDAEAACFGREASVAGGDDELIVVDDEFGEGLAVDLADDGDEDAVGDFDGEAEVDGVGVDDAFADETAGGGGIF
jgi:hypothetical protein